MPDARNQRFNSNMQRGGVFGTMHAPQSQWRNLPAAQQFANDGRMSGNRILPPEQPIMDESKTARAKRAATAEGLLNDTKAFNRLVDLSHKRQYEQDWIPNARRRGMMLGGGTGTLSGIATVLGLITRKPAMVLGGGALGGIGGGAGGSFAGKKMLDNWDAKHGRDYVSKCLSKELEDRLINDLKSESVSSAVGRASAGTSGSGLFGKGVSGLFSRGLTRSEQ
jgi:hypothetical protein